MTIYVENKKLYKGEGIYIGRLSVLGNPFTHLKDKTIARFTVETREDSIIQYRKYFYEQLETNTILIYALKKLLEQAKTKNIHLVCWCKPLSCHGDIVKEYLDSFLQPDFFLPLDS